MSDDRVIMSAAQVRHKVDQTRLELGRDVPSPVYPLARSHEDLRADNAELKKRLAPFVRVAESLADVTDDKTKDLYVELSMWGAIVGCPEGLLLSDFAALLNDTSEGGEG